MRIRSDLRRLGAALGPAALVGGFVVGSVRVADAAQGYSVTPGGFVVSANSLGAASVSCKSSTQKVVGGGFFIAGSASQQYYATWSYAGSNTSWNVAVRNNTGQAVSVKLYAVCATGLDLYQRLGSTWHLPGNTTSSTSSALCPSPRKALGGGFHITGPAPQAYYATRSVPIPGTHDRWLADIRVNGTWATENTTVICALAPPGYNVQMSSSTTIPPNSSGTMTTSPCLGGTMVLSGGFEITGGSPNGPLYAIESVPNFTTWRVTVRNNGLLPATATAYAVCG